jgi:hypothetical protein
MYSAMLPAAVQTAFYLAGVVPVLLPGLNREVWLSTAMRVDDRPLLVIDAGVSPERLVAIADRMLEKAAGHLPLDL